MQYSQHCALMAVLYSVEYVYCNELCTGNINNTVSDGCNGVNCRLRSIQYDRQICHSMLYYASENVI